MTVMTPMTIVLNPKRTEYAAVTAVVVLLQWVLA